MRVLRNCDDLEGIFSLLIDLIFFFKITPLNAKFSI